MFRLAALLIAWLVAAPAWAFLPGQPVGMLNPQVQPANAIAGIPAVNDNLGAGGYPIAGGICAEWGHQVPCNNHYSIVRASTRYVSASDGLYASIPAGVLGLGSNNGALIEEGRTNDALWSRDMTNAAWVATTMTTALNAVGIDGTANSATTLTATGASAMTVQTITLASQADNYSVFLKRVTGSGTINICLAATACASPTACTVTSTTTFTRCTVTATVLNPIIGIQIVTNGDAVIADFNQMEPGGFLTSPILTTNATASRSQDNVTASGLLALSMVGTAGTLLTYTGPAPSRSAGFEFVAGSTGNIFLAYTAFNTPTTVTSVAFSQASLGSGSFYTTNVKVGLTWNATNSVFGANNGALTTQASFSPGATTWFGSQLNTGNFYDGYFKFIGVYSASLSSPTIQALTAGF